MVVGWTQVAHHLDQRLWIRSRDGARLRQTVGDVPRQGRRWRLVGVALLLKRSELRVCRRNLLALVAHVRFQSGNLLLVSLLRARELLRKRLALLYQLELLRRRLHLQ